MTTAGMTTLHKTYNPDPNQWVGWGDRTVDEMAHNWVDVTYLGQNMSDSLLNGVRWRRHRQGLPISMPIYNSGNLALSVFIRFCCDHAFSS